MKINLKGNTSQDSTTGNNLVEKIRSGYLTTVTNQIATTTEASGFGNWQVGIQVGENTSITLSSGTYYASADIRVKSGEPYGKINIFAPTNRDSANEITNQKPTNTFQRYVFRFTLNETKNISSLILQNNYSATNCIMEIKNAMISSANVPYEPYTGGIASPNPDYPQDIHVVSGDNTIKVEGKNLFDYNKITTSAQYTNNYDGTFTRNSNGTNVLINVNDASVPYDTFSLLAGTYSVSFDIKTTTTVTLTNFFMCTKQNDTTSNLAKSIGVQIPANTTTHIKAENYVVVNNAEKVGFAGYLSASTGVVISNIQVEKNTQATSYEPYQGASYPINLGDIELCKIGDYQDSIKKSTGKNLCNTTFELGGIDTTTGQNGSGTDRVRSKDYVEIKANTTYTLSGVQGSRVVCFYNSSKAYLSYAVVGSQSTSGTFTTPNDTSYIRWYIIQTNTNINEMLNEGTTALPYEPYGKVWYLNKQINKVVLDGTQNITLASSGTRRFNATYTTLGISNVKEGTSAEDTTLHYRMNDHFIYSAGQNTWGRYYLYNNWLVMLDSGSAMADANALKTWLASNNTIIYYVLATPTYTEITDSTLLSQLEALNGAKSYATQTNINQENNDNVSILNATALSE